MLSAAEAAPGARRVTATQIPMLPSLHCGTGGHFKMMDMEILVYLARIIKIIGFSNPQGLSLLIISLLTRHNFVFRVAD